MKKKNLTLMLLLVLFFGINSQLSAQNYHFTANQDTILMHCDTQDSTFVWLSLSDPNGELTGPFTVDWKVNGITQTEVGLSTVDTLHWQDTVRYEIFDSTMTSVWIDSIIIYDEAKPEITIYPGYQKNSHACKPTGGTKGQVDVPYIVENIILLQERDTTATIYEGNHFQIFDIYAGVHQMKYNINSCSYYTEFTIGADPKPDLEMHQKYLSTCVDGKFNLMLSDSLIIDSVLLNQYEMLIVNDTNYYLHVPGGDNEITVYAKNCEFYENFFVESEPVNIVEIEEVVLPHENLSTGLVEISSTIEIKEACYIINEIETTVLFDANIVTYDYLPAGEYIFRIKDAGDCLTDLEYVLENLTGNPVPTGFSSDSVFDFKIDGVPINQVPEIGDQYRLVIHKTSGVDGALLVFDTNRGDKLPWDKIVNEEIQYGYFMYYLEITNPRYIGPVLKSNLRLFRRK